MELNIETFLDEEWDTLRNMFCHEDHHPDHFMLQANEYDPNLFLQNFWPVNVNEGIIIGDGNSRSFDNLDYMINVSSQESSNTSDQGGAFCNNNYHLDQFFGEQNINEVANYGQFGNVHGQQPLSINHANSNDHDHEHLLKRKCDAPQAESGSVSTENPTKKSRVSRNATKGKKNVQSKPKLSKMGDMEINKNVGQGPSSYSSEDESCNVLEDTNALKKKGKAKTSRGSATDAQSVYARRRREKINGRLKILQNLIPNGTKVDISTMLEEAVHYVKFLQLQIKLLSSEDKWMYAPIVYNGLDMGLFGENFLI